MSGAAKLRPTEAGLVPAGEGWFVVNAREVRWRAAEGRAPVSDFDGEHPFSQVGVRLTVLGPGEPMSLYHREAAQEDFLVLSGEALLVIEGQERALRAWDFVHCPPGTGHAIIGAGSDGSGPCVVLSVGSREHRDDTAAIVYPPDELATRHGVSVERETSDPREAYADVPQRAPVRYRPGWLPGE